MIKSFKSKETEKIFNRQFSRKLPSDIQKIAFRKLRMLNRATITNDLKAFPNMSEKKISPIHPGEILLEEFIKPMALSQNRVALDIRVPPKRINEIVLGKRSITPDTALRLAKYFNMSPQFWLGLQMDYDLDVAEDQYADKIDKEVHGYNYMAKA